MSAKKDNPFAANIAASSERISRIFGGAAQPLPEEAPAPAPEEAPAPTPEEKPKAKRTPKAAAAPKRTRPAPTSLRLWPDQVDTLRALASARHKERGAGAPDMGAIVREALDEYFERHAAEVSAACE